jgi:tellurite resistance protein TehA-like permease
VATWVGRGRRMAMIARLTDAVSPSVGAVVMASGVVSLCFSTMGVLWLSRPLFAAAALIWIVLAAVQVTRLFSDPARCFEEIRCPAALTLVAGTAVLGSRLAAAGRPGYAQGLLAVGVVLLAVLLPPVLGHWPTPTVGTSFLLSVALQALAVLAARLARGGGQRWEMYVAAAFFGLGLVFYGVVVRLGVKADHGREGQFAGPGVGRPVACDRGVGQAGELVEAPA